jgi:hypothetical protein
MGIVVITPLGHLATERQIPIGTLEDIPDIARNPHQMIAHTVISRISPYGGCCFF